MGGRDVIIRYYVFISAWRLRNREFNEGRNATTVISYGDDWGDQLELLGHFRQPIRRKESVTWPVKCQHCHKCTWGTSSNTYDQRRPSLTCQPDIEGSGPMTSKALRLNLTPKGKYSLKNAEIQLKIRLREYPWPLSQEKRLGSAKRKQYTWEWQLANVSYVQIY